MGAWPEAGDNTVSLWKKITRWLTPAPSAASPDWPFYIAAVECARCGETLTARVHLGNDLSEAEDGNFHCRKVVMGSQRCYQSVELELTFDAQRRLVDRQVTGGRFVDA